MAANVVRPATVSCGTLVARSDRRKKRSRPLISILPAGCAFPLAAPTASVMSAPVLHAPSITYHTTAPARMQSHRRPPDFGFDEPGSASTTDGFDRVDLLYRASEWRENPRQCRTNRPSD